MQAGMQFESILFYRFLFACMALGGILLINRQSFRISRRDIPSLLLLAILYLMSAVFLFWGYKFMASGVATTIHFMYPVLTTLVMMLFFKEKVRLADSRHRLCRDRCLLLIRWKYRDRKFLIFGLFIVLLSALGYALYLVTMSQLKIGRMKGLLLTFYVFLFGGIFLFIGTSSISHLQPIREWHTAGNLILLALIPTVVSNLALVRAVKHRLHTHLCIGSYGTGNCRMCRHLPLWRSIHHKYWRRHCTDYRCCNGNYTETIRAAFL